MLLGLDKATLNWVGVARAKPFGPPTGLQLIITFSLHHHHYIPKWCPVSEVSAKKWRERWGSIVVLRTNVYFFGGKLHVQKKILLKKTEPVELILSSTDSVFFLFFLYFWIFINFNTWLYIYNYNTYLFT